MEQPKTQTEDCYSSGDIPQLRENMRQESMLSTTEATEPNMGKKRAHPAEQGAFDTNGGEPKRRRCGNYGSSGESSSDSTDSTSTQASSTASDERRTASLSGEQLYRGRTRWREGSEPPGWDFMAWYLRPRMVAASFEDRYEEQTSRHHGSESATESLRERSSSTLSPGGIEEGGGRENTPAERDSDVLVTL
ncbi:hypothetical protein TARUN_7283 [Trichoderma arundinaceum]|uniref:Uncharacterized protein n=1 Tax=Trichoderma arundinaceum TaxID=490622 RepID=A0A395NGB7_TRIAR|nr:hypothetical protein TARUN_7283 [Trichoderma arundinaceum]